MTTAADNATPFIPDPHTPRCPSCGATVFVQAETHEVEFKLANGKTEQRVRYRVRKYLVETLPAVMSACGCSWLASAVAAGLAATRAGAQRVFVTTAPGATALRAPSFVLPATASDEFVAARVRGEFGQQEDGSDHEWEAHDIKEGTPADAAGQ